MFIIHVKKILKSKEAEFTSQIITMHPRLILISETPNLIFRFSERNCSQNASLGTVNDGVVSFRNVLLVCVRRLLFCMYDEHMSAPSEMPVSSILCAHEGTLYTASQCLLAVMALMGLDLYEQANRLPE